MKIIDRVERFFLKRKAVRVALELAAIHREYRTRLAIHGGSAYIYAQELAQMAGRVDALTLELELTNRRLGLEC